MEQQILETPEAEEFLRIVRELNSLMIVSGQEREEHGTSRPARRDIALTNTRFEIREAAAALNMLAERLLELRAVGERIWDESIPEDHRREALRRSSQVGGEAEVLIKALYHYFYGIQQLVNLELDLRARVPEQDAIELTRVCHYRHASVAHLKARTVHTRFGRKSHTAKLEIYLSHAPMWLDAAQLAEVHSLFRGVEDRLPLDVQATTNVHEQMRVLYRHYPRLPGQARGQLHALIEKYGVESDPPLILARLLLSLANAFHSSVATEGASVDKSVVEHK